MPRRTASGTCGMALVTAFVAMWSITADPRGQSKTERTAQDKHGQSASAELTHAFVIKAVASGALPSRPAAQTAAASASGAIVL